MEAWQQFLSEIKKELGQAPFDKWIKDLKVVRFDAANLFLEAQDSFQIAWFEEHIRPRLKGRLFNNNGRSIRVHLSSARKEKERVDGDLPLKPATEEFQIRPDVLDPEMTFDSFIPSAENLVVYKLIKESVDHTSFNPIYIYGPSSTGKTHLLLAAATYMQKKGKRVFYVKAESFTEHVVQAIRKSQMQNFRKVYRDIDVLIIDDIHIFSRKNATQEEFFHTFNTLHTLGKLILLSANVPPSQLVEIEPRLVSRFEWGIALGLEKGDKKPILEKKAEQWKLTLAHDLIPYLIRSFQDPVIALQALALRSGGKGTLNQEMASKYLRDFLSKEEESALTPEKLIKFTAGHFGIKSEDLLGKSQMREYALPRQVAMYLCREKLQLPYLKIADLFGRDHSTVISSVKGIQKGIDDKKAELIEAIGKIAP